MSAENPTQIHATGEAMGFIPAPGDIRIGFTDQRFTARGGLIV